MILHCFRSKSEFVTSDLLKAAVAIRWNTLVPLQLLNSRKLKDGEMLKSKNDDISAV